jgi:putative acetyltransferase
MLANGGTLVEPATGDDFDDVCRVFFAAFPAAHRDVPLARMEDHAPEIRMILDYGQSLVFRTDGVVFGFLCRVEDEITDFYVLPAEQGNGIGTALLGQAMGAQSPLHLHVFESNAVARRYYAARGFTELEPVWDQHTRVRKIKLEWNRVESLAF